MRKRILTVTTSLLFVLPLAGCSAGTDASGASAGAGDASGAAAGAIDAGGTETETETEVGAGASAAGSGAVGADWEPALRAYSAAELASLPPNLLESVCLSLQPYGIDEPQEYIDFQKRALGPNPTEADVRFTILGYDTAFHDGLIPADAEDNDVFLVLGDVLLDTCDSRGW